MGKTQIFGLLAIMIISACDHSLERQYISNPLINISCADPSIIKYEDTFYLYATEDPWGGEELVVLTSKDFQNWERKHISWPNLEDCTSPTSLDARIWAPGVIKGMDGRFYMYVSVHNEIWAGVADHPTGPWKNAKADNSPLIPGDMFPKYHMIDAEPFIDDDGQAYLYWGSGWDWKDGHCFITRLQTDMVTFDQSEIRDITPPHYFEAPFMLKKGGKYFLMYSNGKCTDDTYQVRVSFGSSPYGPWEELEASPILSTNKAKNTVGPGHHTVFEVEGQHYILYHRITENNNTLLRELAIDSLNFDDEGKMLAVVPDKGVTKWIK